MKCTGGSSFSNWLELLAPSDRLFSLIDSLGGTVRFVMSGVQLIVGVLNIWIPELNSLIQMEEYADGTHDDQMRVSFLLAMLQVIMGYLYVATSVVEGFISLFVTKRSRSMLAPNYAIWRLIWDFGLTFGGLFLNIFDLLINTFLFNDYYDVYLEYMILFNGFISFYQLAVIALGYFMDLISKLV